MYCAHTHIAYILRALMRLTHSFRTDGLTTGVRKALGHCGVRMPLAVLSLAVLLAILCASDAKSQQRVLVSNIGQINARPLVPSLPGSPIASSLGLADNAQSFTTGSNSAGYKINNVEIRFSRIATGLTYTVRIQQAGTSGPGTTVATLTTPSFSTSITPQLLSFSAPTANLTLNASTEYFVVLDVSGTRTDQITTWRNTESVNEDPIGINDWSIKNTHIYRANSGTDTNWRDNFQPSSLKFRINGEVLTTPGVTVTPTSVTVTEASGSEQTETYTVVLDSKPTHPVTIAVASDTTTAATVSPSSLTFTAQSWATAQTVTVRGVDDTTDQSADKTAKIEHTASSTDTNYDEIDIEDVSVTVTDNDIIPVISVSLPDVEGITDRNGIDLYTEDVSTVTFNVTATPTPPSALTVCINIAEQFGDRVAGAQEGHKTISIPSGTNPTSVMTQNVTWTDDSTDERDSHLRFTVVPPSDSNCSQSGYTVSPTEGSEEIWIADNDPTEVTLAGDDLTMTEGNASDTATITVSLGRRLFADEMAKVPVNLASVTGANLPGTATPDFTVSASGDGVTITDATSDSPDVVFTGHDMNTVQSARVTLTPVANRDDGDTDHETLTATLATDSVLSASDQSNLGGGMSRGTGFTASMSIADDEGAPPGLVISEESFRLSENGGSVSYTVSLSAVPTHSVIIAVVSDTTTAATVSPSSLTFTTTNWNIAQNVTVTAVDEEAMHRNRSLKLSHQTSSTDSRYNSLQVHLPVEVLDAPEVTAFEPFGLLRKPEFEGTWTAGRWSGPSLKPPMPMGDFYRGIRRDVVIGEALNYHIHLSNRPVGGPVRVTATVADFNKAGLALRRDGVAQASLTLTFNDSDVVGGICSLLIAPEGADGTWRCSRKVWIVRKLPTSEGGCTDVSHTVSGGGVRTSTAVGNIRAQILGQRHNGNLPCRFIDLDAYPSLTPEMRAANALLPQNSEESVPSDGQANGPFNNLLVPVFEGKSTTLTVDLGRAMKAGERVHLTLDFSGATPNEDYTLALVTDGSKGVTVSEDAPLTEASPVLVFTEGSQTAEILLTVVDDAEFEREELTVSFGELRRSVKGATEHEVQTPEGSLVFALIDSTGPPLTIIGLEDASVEENVAWSATPWLEGVTGAVNWTLSGTDSARFSLDPKTGALTLVAQDYEAPSDADGDNVYEATLKATDPGGTSTVAFKVTVTDVEIEPLTVSLAAEATSVAENNGRVKFTITLSRALGAEETAMVPFTMKGGKAGRDWNVRFPPGDNGPEVSRTANGSNSEVTFTEGGRVATLTLIARPNHDTEERMIRIAFGTGESAPRAKGVTEGMVPVGNVLAITILDDDAAAGPALWVKDARVLEASGTMRFTVRLNMPATEVVKVRARTRDVHPVSARAGQDYTARRVNLKFRPGQTEKHVRVRIVDDSHDEGEETFEFVLSNAEGATIADRVAIGTIKNDDPLPGAYLARFGRTVGNQITYAISDRMAAPREPGLEVTVAGQPLSWINPGDGAPEEIHTNETIESAVPETATRALFEEIGAEEAEAQGMTGEEILQGRRFMLTTPQDASGGSLSIWGRGAYGSFEGRDARTGTPVTVDGEVTTGMLGVDYTRERLTFGATFTHSAGNGGYEGEGAIEDEKTGGQVETTLNALTPWASMDLHERLTVWGALGLGTGDMTLTPDGANPITTDIDWRMAALGTRGRLTENEGGFVLDLTSDAFWTRTSSEAALGLAASSSDVTRLLLGLEGYWENALRPGLEMGLRHDGGDAETGFGVEAGGSINWTNPNRGFDINLEGRMLVLHENDDLKDWGISLSLGYDPHPETKRGFSASISQNLGGASSGGVTALLNPEVFPENLGNGASGAVASGWEMETSYGFPTFGGRFTTSPHVGVGFTRSLPDYTLGWRLTPEMVSAPDLLLGMKATRRESETAEAEHAVRLEIVARW